MDRRTSYMYALVFLVIEAAEDEEERYLAFMCCRAASNHSTHCPSDMLYYGLEGIQRLQVFETQYNFSPRAHSSVHCVVLMQSATAVGNQRSLADNL